MRIDEIKKLVGNTPFCMITCKFQGKIKHILAKLEWYNISGSIKDRVALYIIENSYKNKTLKYGQKIVETTSGNTGIAFACLGGLLCHPVTIIMPEWMSEERKKLLMAYGAELRLVKKEEGGFLKGLEIAKSFKNCFLPLQFENQMNVMCHYETTGEEILKSLKKNKIIPSAFIAGVGTGGTLMGVGKKLKTQFKQIKVIAIEPKSSPILRVGYKTGSHKIEGISDDFIPPIYEEQNVDKIFDVSDEDAIYFAQKLAEIGLGVGISSGANFFGALICEEDYIVTTFADDNKKYMSTVLSKKISKDYNFEIIDFMVI